MGFIQTGQPDHSLENAQDNQRTNDGKQRQAERLAPPGMPLSETWRHEAQIRSNLASVARDGRCGYRVMGVWAEMVASFVLTVFRALVSEILSHG
jgi:hypothetical protein